MIKKLKKYHRDFEIAQNESKMWMSEDISCFGCIKCFEFCLDEKTSKSVFSDMNGVYDMSEIYGVYNVSSNEMSAFCISFSESFVWPSYICDY